MLYVIIPLTLVVVGTLLWAWWEDRLGRDPVSSIDSFHRALSAMEPRHSQRDGGGDAHPDGDAHRRRQPPDRGNGDTPAGPAPDRREAAAR